jgi:hypothetical protein
MQAQHERKTISGFLPITELLNLYEGDFVSLGSPSPWVVDGIFSISNDIKTFFLNNSLGNKNDTLIISFTKKYSDRQDYVTACLWLPNLNSRPTVMTRQFIISKHTRVLSIFDVFADNPIAKKAFINQ